MPAPLFPIVWQYQNQTIDVLANDISGLIVNTDKFIPVSNGFGFVDSTLIDDGVSVRGQYQYVPMGIDMHYLTGKYQFGAIGTGNACNLTINDGNGTVRMNTNIGSASYWGINGTTDTLEAVGVSAATAGAAASLFLKVLVDSVPYKIQLLADA